MGAWAQTPLRPRFVQLSGFTLSRDSLQPVTYATIVNQRSRLGTISGENGYFSVSGLRGDTITFTAIGFLPVHYVVPLLGSADVQAMKVIMTPQTYELSEVLIRPYSEGQFKKELLTLKLPSENNPQLKLPEIVQPGLSKDIIYTGSGIAVQGPISALYNKFSRRGKELKEIASLRNSEERSRIYKAKLNPDFVSRVTGLKDQALAEFMTYCHPAENFVLNANEYDLALALHDCLKTFKPTASPAKTDN